MTDIVDPPPIDPLPPAPLPTDTEEQHDAKAYALIDAQVEMVGQLNAANEVTKQNALAAQERAQTAVQAAASAQEARAAVRDAVGLQGAWSEASGAAQKDWTYKHSGRFWRLKQAVADISAHEPTAEDVYWLALDAGTRPQVLVNSGAVACVPGVTYIITGDDVMLTAPSAGLIQGDYFGFRLAAAVSGTQLVDFGALAVRSQAAGLRAIDVPAFGLDLEFSNGGWV